MKKLAEHRGKYFGRSRRNYVWTIFR